MKAHEEIERLRTHDRGGWHGLANLYFIITGQHCEDEVALGMATSAVMAVKERLALLEAEHEAARGADLDTR